MPTTIENQHEVVSIGRGQHLRDSGERSAALRGTAGWAYSSTVTSEAEGAAAQRSSRSARCRGTGGPSTLMVPCTPVGRKTDI